jgi:hypothetical protein
MENSAVFSNKVRNALVLRFYSSTPTVSSVFRTAFPCFEGKLDFCHVRFVCDIICLKCILFLAFCFHGFGMQDDTFDSWVTLGHCAWVPPLCTCL